MAADTYSTTLGVLLMGTGNDSGTWGSNQNTAVFQILEDAIANILAESVTGGTLDLSGTPPPNAASQARYGMISFTGTLTSAQTVKVPNLGKIWLVKNGTAGAFSLTMQTPAPVTSAVIPQDGKWYWVNCDANNNIALVGPGLGSTQTWSGTNTYSGTLNVSGTFQIGGQTFTFPATGTLVGGLGTSQTWSGVNTFNNILNITGTFKSNGNVMTFPASGDTLPGVSQNNTWTGTNTFNVGATAIGSAATTVGYTGGATSTGCNYRTGNNANNFAIGFYNAAGQVVGSISTGASTTSFITTSDRKLKKNIRRGSIPLDLLKKVKVRLFDWRKGGGRDVHGLVAQEFAKIYPQAVTRGDARRQIPWSIDHGRITPLLLDWLQQLLERVEELEAGRR